MSARALADRLAALSPAQRALFEKSLRKGEKEEAQPRPAPVPSLGAVPKRAQWSPCPLSIDQERLWFIQQLDPSSPVYNIYNAIRFRGPLDLAALTAAVDEVVRRQDALRTSFPAVEGQPVQVIAPHWKAELPIVDLRSLPEALREAEAERAAEAVVRRPFVLDRLPLFNFPLIRVDDEDVIQPTVFHHIIVDRLSAEIMTVELKVLYHAILHGLPSPLPELTVQFADFAVWQRQRLEAGGLLAGQLEWWTKRLRGVSELLALPLDRPRPPVQGPNGARRRLTLSKAHSDGLRGLAQSGSATLFIGGLAVLKALLVRLCGQERLTLGTPYDYRQGPDLEPLLGFFINQLVLYTDLSGDPPFREVLARVRETAVGAYEHSELPFARLIEALKPARDLSRIPYTQVVFLLLPLPVHALPGLTEQGRADVDEVEMDSYWVDARRTQFDINFALWEEEDGRLNGFIEHSTDLFDATTIHRMREQFRSLLAAVLADPGRRLWDLPLLSEAQSHQLLTEWNPRGASPATFPLHRRFEEHARRTPEAAAATFEDRSISYGDLDRHANRLAHQLLASGVEPGSYVGLCAGRGLGLVAGILAILKAGCAYVPLDPDYPADRLAFILADVGRGSCRPEGPSPPSPLPPALTPARERGAPAQESFSPPLPGDGSAGGRGGRGVRVLAERASLEKLAGFEGRALLLDLDDAGADPGSPEVAAGLEFPAYVIYTSGSTGRPKGVVVTHGNVARLLGSTEGLFGFGPSDVWTVFHSFAFDFSVWEIWGALAYGGRLVVVPYWVSRSPEVFHSLLARERVTVLNQTPSAFRQLLAVDAPTALSSLRWVIFGGEALDARSLAPWWDRYGDGQPGLVNMYGITETTVHATFCRLRREDSEAGRGSGIGVPLPDLAIHVLDPLGQPQPIGVSGELNVAGSGLALGYLGRPDLTAERFVPDPYGEEPGGRLYRSGDLGRRLASGEIEYQGRIDHQVKIRGHRIELGEVEAALVLHPGVKEAVVAARGGDVGDGGDARLVAWIVGGADGTVPAVEALREHLRARLPEPMVPAVFVSLDALPLTPSGKLDRKALPEPGGGRPELGTEYVPPRTAAEEALCEVWAQVLRVERVGIHDNFFALGGDSILSLRAVALARGRGLALTLPDLFRHQTVAELALHIAEEETPAAAPVHTAPFSLISDEDRARISEGAEDVEDAYPLAALQAGMMYHMVLRPEDPPYHNVDSWHLKGPFEPGPFQEAVDRVVQRHPILRTSFDLTGFGEPLQIVHREARLPVAVEDLRHLSDVDQDAAVDILIAREKRRLHDFALAPQLRMHVQLRSDGAFQLTLTENHAIFDGWSLHETLSELFGLYLELLDGHAPPEPPPLALTYRDFVARERQALTSPEAAAYWERVLADRPMNPLPHWPSWPKPELWPRIRGVVVPLSRSAFHGLKALAREAAVPFKSVLLSAHFTAQGRLTGSADVITGIVSNGRMEEAGGDQVRGLFLNTLPLRLNFPEGSWIDLARAVARAEQEMLPFRRMPFAALQRRYGGGAGDRPIFEMPFNYIHFHAVRDLLRTGRIEMLDFKRAEGSNFLITANFSQALEEVEIGCELEYDSAVWAREQVEAIGALYGRIVETMAADPRASYRTLPLLSEPERQQLLCEWNDTATDGEPALLHELFAAQAARTPEALAVVSGNVELTYGELARRAGELAGHLQSLGVVPETRVAICLERSPAWAVAILGVMAAGGAYVPLDPDYPESRLAFMLEDSGAEVVVTQEGLAERLLPDTGSIGPRVLFLDTPLQGRGRGEGSLPPGREDGRVRGEDRRGVGADRENGPSSLLEPPPLLSSPHSQPPPSRGGGTLRSNEVEESTSTAVRSEGEGLRPHNAAYVIYTSGSTGTPKGVVVEHRSIVGLLLTGLRLYRMRAGDRASFFSALSFDASLLDLFHPLLVGGTSVLFQIRPTIDADQIAAGLGELTVIHGIPALLRQIAQTAGGRYPNVREVLTGGDAIPADLPRELSAVFPSARIHFCYGPTETTVYCCHEVWDGDTDRAIPTPPPPGSMLGRPLEDAEILLLDADRRPLPIGVAGEIYIGGDCVARGYLDRPELTAERFPEIFGRRFYRSGDLGRQLPDGRIEFLGRIDSQIKVRGVRIEPAEVEAALLAHPGVSEAAVVARAEGEGKRLVAFVVPRGEDVSVADLRIALRERLPEPMVPSAFVVLPALPLSPAGKVDRLSLSRMEAVPRTGGEGGTRTYQAPRTPVEEAVASLWSEVLGVERVGGRDDFFELGGHSLLATRAVSRVRAAFGVEIPLGALFERPTVAGFAAAVEEALRRGPSFAERPLGPRPQGAAAPLSFSQQRLWFLSRFEPGSAAYNMPLAVRLQGYLDARALATALAEIVRRHESLRTTFAEGANGPVQVVAPSAFVLPTVDLTALGSGAEEEAQWLAEEDAGRPFDLERGPLFRPALLRLAAGESGDAVLLAGMHHIVSDGWSTGVLLGELVALYGAFRQGRLSPLPEPAVQYADFALWQRERLSGEALDAELGYWREHLAGLPAVLELPADRSRPPVRRGRGATRPLSLGSDLAAGLRSLARSTGATLFMVLLAGVEALLARLADQEGFALGTPIAGRDRLETEGLIGFFVNTLVLRADLVGDPGFRALLGRAKEEALAAYAHQGLPFEKLVEELEPERSLAHTPLFQVLFALQNTAPAVGSGVELPGVTITPFGVEETHAKFDLTLGLSETSAGLSGGVEYDRDLFDGATIDRWMRHLETLLSAAVADPGRRLAELPLLAPDERRQILHAWNDTATDYPREAPLADLFEDWAGKQPDAPALLWDDREWTYAELNSEAERLAGQLRGFGVGPEVRVAIRLPRSADGVIATLAVVKAGGVYVPLDPDHPAERLEWMMRDAGAAVLLDGRLEGEAVSAPGPRLGGDALAYVMYTSGSTGQPKGVAVTQRGVVRLVRETNYAQLTAADRMALASNPAFDAATLEIWSALLNGGCLVGITKEELLSPYRFADVLRRRRVSAMILTAALFHQTVSQVPDAFAPLSHLLVGGDAMDPQRAREALAAGPPQRLLNAYGPTEATTYSSWYEVRGLSPEAVTVPIGKPLSNDRVHVLDRTLEPQPFGVPGELYLGGDGLARGYLGRPDLTAERFVPDPHGVPGGRLYRTGDLARRRPDGDVELLGRIDRQVKIRGFRVEPGEVEAALTEHPEVREAAVVVRREAQTGERELIAWVSGPDVDVRKLRQALADRLPAYLVPARIVPLPSLPLTPNGKVDRIALAHLEPDHPGAAAGASRFAPPQTPAEELLAEIWAEVLGLPARRIGVQDNFFELSGHSLLAAQVAQRVRQVFGVDLPLRRLFERATLADLAREIETGGAGEPTPPPIERAPRDRPIPASFYQAWCWKIQGGPVSAELNMPLALHLLGPLDIPALRRALEEIARRHESMRTTFREEDGEIFQVIHPPAPVPLPVIDLRGLPEEIREAAVEPLATEDAALPFDLARGPLWRVPLVQLGPEDSALLLNMHHAISDGWSLEVLRQEMEALYPVFLEGRSPELPELPLQFADFAVWQRRILSGETFEAQLDWWRRHLADLPPVLELPADRPRPEALSGRAVLVYLTVPPEPTRELQAAAREAGCTMAMLLCTALNVLLHRYTGRREIVLGTISSGRHRTELAGLIGLFMNNLPLRLDLSGEPDEPTFRELMRRVREEVLAIYAHQDVPFPRLLEEVFSGQKLHRLMLFRVHSNLLSFPLKPPAEGDAMPGLSIGLHAGGKVEAHYDLSVQFAETPEGVRCRFLASADLVSAESLARMIEDYGELLAQAAADPGTTLDRFLPAPRFHPYEGTGEP